MWYEEKTYELLLKNLLKKVPSNLDKREGSVIWNALAPAAAEIAQLYIELEWIFNQCFADTADREYLIRKAAERGLHPKPASCAILKGIFNKNVPIGSRFNLGECNYTVVEELNHKEFIYKLQCETTGSVGNKKFGALTPIGYIPDLFYAELIELLIPGEDEEETEDFRTRYFDSFNEKSFGGNIQDYIEKTNTIPGVGSTKVTRVWNNDLRPAELIPSIVIQEWYNTIKPTLNNEPAAWLETVFNAAVDKKLTTGGTVLLTILDSDFGVASDTLIQIVQQTIDPNEYAGEGYGVAPIGHVVKVESVKARSITIKTNITFDVGYDWSNLQGSINDVISNYLLELRKTWADSSYLVVRISQIEARLLSIKGIIDVENTKMNGVSENLILGKYEIPVFGGVST